MQLDLRFLPQNSLIEGQNDALDYLNSDGTIEATKWGKIYISAKLDLTIGKIYNDIEWIIINSNEHESRLNILRKMKINAGNYSSKKEILENVSPFEQMVSIKDWLNKESISCIHTFFLSLRYGHERNKKEYISVKVKPTCKKVADTFNLILGSTKGERKALKYEELAQHEPWGTKQEPLALTLDSLEIIRQPHYSASTIIKGNAYESDYISNEWRYSKYNIPNDPQSGYKLEACVELKNQRTGHKNHKNQSAYHNIVNLYEILPDDDDNFCYPVHYEDYTDRNKDDVEIEVSPSEIIEALKISIKTKNDDPLYNVLFKLFVGKIGVPQQTPELKEFIAKKLFL